MIFKNKDLLCNNKYKVILMPPRIINKNEINKALSSINQEMEEARDEFENLFQKNAILFYQKINIFLQ